MLSPEVSQSLIDLSSLATTTMAYRASLLQSCRTPIRSFLTQSPSPLSASRIIAVGKNEASPGFRTLRGVALSILKRNQLALTKCYSAGRRLSVRSIIGVSMAYEFINSWPGVTFAMAGDEHCVERSYTTATSHIDSAIDKDQQALWNFVKKVWIPSLLLVNVVLTSWSSPIEFVIKIVLALLSTKPNPFSIYISVEQLCDQYKLRHPWSYSSKPLKAKNVDVSDYRLFCIGRVVVQDQEFTLIGVFGAWWVWPSHLLHDYLQFQTGFDQIRDRARKRLTLEVAKPATQTQCS